MVYNLLTKTRLFFSISFTGTSFDSAVKIKPPDLTVLVKLFSFISNFNTSKAIAICVLDSFEPFSNKLFINFTSNGCKSGSNSFVWVVDTVAST